MDGKRTALFLTIVASAVYVNGEKGILTGLGNLASTSIVAGEQYRWGSTYQPFSYNGYTNFRSNFATVRDHCTTWNNKYNLTTTSHDGLGACGGSDSSFRCIPYATCMGSYEVKDQIGTTHKPLGPYLYVPYRSVITTVYERYTVESVLIKRDVMARICPVSTHTNGFYMDKTFPDCTYLHDNNDQPEIHYLTNIAYGQKMGYMLPSEASVEKLSLLYSEGGITAIETYALDLILSRKENMTLDKVKPHAAEIATEVVMMALEKQIKSNFTIIQGGNNHTSEQLEVFAICKGRWGHFWVCGAGAILIQIIAMMFCLLFIIAGVIAVCFLLLGGIRADEETRAEQSRWRRGQDNISSATAF